MTNVQKRTRLLSQHQWRHEAKQRKALLLWSGGEALRAVYEDVCKVLSDNSSQIFQKRCNTKVAKSKIQIWILKHQTTAQPLHLLWSALYRPYLASLIALDSPTISVFRFPMHHRFQSKENQVTLPNNINRFFHLHHLMKITISWNSI